MVNTWYNSYFFFNIVFVVSTLELPLNRSCKIKCNIIMNTYAKVKANYYEQDETLRDHI